MLEVMNQKLIHYLESNKIEILEQWSSQFVIHLFSHQMKVIDAYLKIIERSFSDTILLLAKEKINMDGSSETLPECFQNEPYPKLSYLLEVFLSGEEVLYTRLLLRSNESHDFSNEEVAYFFESLRRVFDILIRYYTCTLCEGCAKPLMQTHHDLVQLGGHVSQLSHGLCPKMGAAYDG